MSDRNNTEQIFEAALAGRDIADDAAPAVVELVEALRAESNLFGSPGDAEAHITAAAAAVPGTNPSRSQPSRKRSRGRRLRRRLVVLAASFALLAATAGVGVANDAIPGEALYDLDLVLENMGIGDGGPSERAAEVLELLSQGHTGLALGHAATTISTLPEPADEDGEATETLEAVAEMFAEDESTVPEEVAELIASLANSIGTGDGESISALAQAIEESVDVDEGQPDDAPDEGPPSSLPTPPVPTPAP